MIRESLFGRPDHPIQSKYKVSVACLLLVARHPPERVLVGDLTVLARLVFQTPEVAAGALSRLALAERVRAVCAAYNALTTKLPPTLKKCEDAMAACRFMSFFFLLFKLIVA